MDIFVADPEIGLGTSGFVMEFTAGALDTVSTPGNGSFNGDPKSGLEAGTRFLSDAVVVTGAFDRAVSGFSGWIFAGFGDPVFSGFSGWILAGLGDPVLDDLTRGLESFGAAACSVTGAFGGTALEIGN